MISRLRGIVLQALPNRLEIDVNGVAYFVHIAVTSFDKLNPVEGETLEVFTHHHVREQEEKLFGFASDEERSTFLLLVDRVSGIGPSTAINIFSSLSVEEFKGAVANEDATALAKAKGLGKKTAERIVLELKDKVGVVEGWQSQQTDSPTTPKDQATTDAELALIALGFKQADAKKSVANACKLNPEANVDELIKLALRRAL